MLNVLLITVMVVSLVVRSNAQSRLRELSGFFVKGKAAIITVRALAIGLLIDPYL
jgi:hypothetical protein